MADITVTAANVSVVHRDRAIVISGELGTTVTAGQAIYPATDGQWELADGSAAASVNGVCLALEGGVAGDVVSILVEGFVYGFTVSSINGNVAISVSDTAGALDNGAGSPTKVGTVGRVWAIPDNGSVTKLLYFRSNLNTIVT